MATKQSGLPLSATFVRTIRVPGRYGDGRGGFGLSLLVRRTANGRTSRMWCQRIHDPATGKQTSRGLGSYPLVSLAEARKLAIQNAREAKAGAKLPPSFERATDLTIRLARPSWKEGSRTEVAWRNSFAAHIFPTLGTKRVDKITTSDLLDVLGPLWHSKPSQATILKRNLSKVFRWAIAKGYRSDDPASDQLTDALGGNGRKKRGHYRALHHSAVSDALAKVGDSGATPALRLATRFLALVAARGGEVRGATWSEIEGDTWVIPAGRMKSGREFRVPLSTEAREVLAEARDVSGSDGLIFPGRGGKEISHSGISTLFRRLGIKATPHGLRSSFRDWCGETGVAREVAEACLAHVVGSATERAYARSDLLERRRAVMEAWASYIG